MFVISVFAVTTLITLSKSTPLSYVTHQRRDVATDGDNGVYIPYLIDERGLSVNEFYWPQVYTIYINNLITIHMLHNTI